MSKKSSLYELIIYGLIAILVFLFGYQYLSNQLTLFEFSQAALATLVLYATILMALTSLKTAKASEKQAEASELQAKAAQESIRASVQPSISFQIRPANDFWSKKDIYNISTWVPGVGIYIDNVGAGHAFNIKFKCKIIGENEEHGYDISFKRLLSGERYTIPSKNYPKLEIKKTHRQVIIESLEYDDVRKPPNKYKYEEPEVLEIYPELFNEPNKKDRSMEQV